MAHPLCSLCSQAHFFQRGAARHWGLHTPGIPLISFAATLSSLVCSGTSLPLLPCPFPPSLQSVLSTADAEQVRMMEERVIMVD